MALALGSSASSLRVGSGTPSRMYRGSTAFWDADAAAYIRAVEAADGQALELGVCNAYHKFVLACKDASIWSAIKSCCILAGARTLAGALVPLVGTAPTNNNFVAADYTRGGATPGLAGDGSTKYLDSNRNNNADITTNHHIAAYATRNRDDASDIIMGFRIAGNDTGGKFVGYRSTLNGTSFVSTPSTDANEQGNAVAAGTSTLHGLSRSASGTYTSRSAGSSITHTRASTTAASGDIFVFGLSNAGSLIAPTDARIAFYSIGESIDLAALDDAVSALVTAIGAAV